MKIQMKMTFFEIITLFAYNVTRCFWNVQNRLYLSVSFLIYTEPEAQLNQSQWLLLLPC